MAARDFTIVALTEKHAEHIGGYNIRCTVRRCRHLSNYRATSKYDRLGAVITATKYLCIDHAPEYCSNHNLELPAPLFVRDR